MCFFCGSIIHPIYCIYILKVKKLCPMAFVLWSLSHGLCPMVFAGWLCPMVFVGWLCPMVFVGWLCPMAFVLWSLSYGFCPMVVVLWLLSYGRCPMVFVLWFLSYGFCRVDLVETRQLLSCPYTGRIYRTFNPDLWSGPFGNCCHKASRYM